MQGEQPPIRASTPADAVFLSYASQDAGAARRMCEALRAAGIDVWFDESELRGGDAWDHKIRSQIHDCRLFVAIISASTEKRDEGYFRREWRLAVERAGDMAHKKTFLIPVVIDGTPQRGASVPDKFHELQWTRLPGGETPPAFVERIKRLLVLEAAPVDGPTVRGHAPARSARQPSLPTPILWGAGAVAAAVCAYLVLHELPLSTPPSSQSLPTRTAAQQAAPPAGNAAAPSASPHSIAVLPFVNMSGDKEQEYFADGLTEELIDQLAQGSDLKVIARTSSFQFKGRNEDVRTIAAKLAVANLLEGSVRRAGKMLRITAQLVRASDGLHIWSHTYDRTLKDIFKVQSEIAETVTRELNAVLTQSAAPDAPQPNFEAYNLVLQGNFFKARRSPEDLARAIALFKQAIQVDPRYALPWARLGSAYLAQVRIGSASQSDGIPRARAALQHAIELDQHLLWAHYTMAGVYMSELNWEGAAAEIARMQESDPNDKELLPSSKADMYVIWCRMPQAIAISHQLVERNPLDPYSLSGLADREFAAGQLDAAIDTYRRLIALAPGYAGAQASLGQALVFAGRYAEALAATQKESQEAVRLEVLPIVYWAQGDRTRSDQALRELVSRHGDESYGIAEAYAYRGQVGEALDWLERSYQHRDPNLTFVKCDPLLRGLQHEPRYQALLAKLNLIDTPRIH